MNGLKSIFENAMELAYFLFGNFQSFSCSRLLTLSANSLAPFTFSALPGNCLHVSYQEMTFGYLLKSAPSSYGEINIQRMVPFDHHEMFSLTTILATDENTDRSAIVGCILPVTKVLSFKKVFNNSTASNNFWRLSSEMVVWPPNRTGNCQIISGLKLHAKYTALNSSTYANAANARIKCATIKLQELINHSSIFCILWIQRMSIREIFLNQVNGDRSGLG